MVPVELVTSSTPLRVRRRSGSSSSG